MNKDSEQGKTNRMLFIGISLGAVYWIIDSFLYVISSYEPDFFSGLLGPDFDGISTRIIVLCLFVIFGSHVQYTFKQKKWTESEFDKLKEKNEELEREISELKNK